ncbi:hypothetical protein B0H17DRAFT_1039134 [Mycena rosella]|uniref:DUF6534 domain-containing protein n=1 Tax=Mycena rosella TaxID=1033263 RepID=A0AAD7GSD1_MYCRO|nr:hypothetical protein B0H17DRAFT_1039134 [Mycena rosella]
MSDPLRRHEAIFLLGPWLAGSCIDIFLQGVLTCQIFNYYSWYHEDKLILHVYVGGLAILSVLKSVQAFAIIWIQSILFIGDIDGAILLNYTSWIQAGNPMMVATFDLYVQTYFCYRLFVICKKLPVVAPVAVVFLFAFCSMILATYYITLGVSASSKIANWFAAHLSSVFAADILLSCSTAYFLIQSKRNVLPQTVGLISALVRLTFQTAAPAAICAMFNLIFSQVYTGSNNLVSTAFNMALPKLYAVSMMWTLNARRTIRAAHSSRNGVSSSNELSGNRTRRTRARDEVELGNFGGIQVHTTQETVQHIDVRGMFAHPEHETKSREATAADAGSEEYKR